MSTKEKRRIGDRRDGKLLKNTDSMHQIMPLIYPNRCDNEAFILERIDLENIDRFLAEKNANDPAFKYTLFHLIVTAVIRVCTLRPKMNRFIANKNLYQRNEVSASFTIKKQFADDAGEGLAFIHATPDSTLESIHEEIRRQVQENRGGKTDASTDAMDTFSKLPRPILKTAVAFIAWLERHGKAPKSLIETDPYYSSVILSNIGSIKLKAAYHHLTNWGTTSMFVAIGRIQKRPFYQDDGSYVMKNSVDLGLTIDERLADGYYYSKTVRLLKYLLENPELLEEPVSKEVDFDV